MNWKAIAVCGAVALLVALLPSSGVSSPRPEPPVRVAYQMSGDKHVHGPTDPDARGRAVFNVVRRHNRLCWFIEFTNLGTPPFSEENPEPMPTAAQIHRGAKGEAGPMALSLFVEKPTPSPAEGCLRHLSRDFLTELVRTPGAFYVNLITEQYPEGALRGQLRRPK